MELWPLDEDALVKRCTDAGLWQSNDAGASTSYWSDEMAAVSADADRLALLVGRLTFCGGEWWLRDGAGGVRCVVTEAAPGPPAAGVVVSAAHFVVHRETFRTEDTEDLVRVYVTLNADRVHVVRGGRPFFFSYPFRVDSMKKHASFHKSVRGAYSIVLYNEPSHPS